MVFVVGQSAVIKGEDGAFAAYRATLNQHILVGLDESVLGLRPGGIRTALVPPSLAFGSEGNSTYGVPPNSWVSLSKHVIEFAMHLADFFLGCCLIGIF